MKLIISTVGLIDKQYDLIFRSSFAILEYHSPVQRNSIVYKAPIKLVQPQRFQASSIIVTWYLPWNKGMKIMMGKVSIKKTNLW